MMIGKSGLQLFPDPVISIIKLLDKNPEYEERIIDIVTDQIEEHFALRKGKKEKVPVCWIE
jgi:hypothetical protein